MLLRFVLMINLTGVAAAMPAPDKPVTDTEMKAIANGNTEFALDLYSRLASEKGNLFFSPYSISTALAMTYAGARGETAEQMAKTLHFNIGQEQLHPAFAALMRQSQPAGKDQPFQLSVANALWGQKGVSFLPAFLSLVKTNYGAGLREVDFAATEQARLTINGWVEEHTKNKIRDLIKSGVLKPDTKLVLTNAIYFKAPWEEQFKAPNTKPEDFFVTPDQKVQAPMMHQTEFAGYFEGSKFQLLDLRYKGGEQSMLLVLPKKDQMLAAVEKELSAKSLQSWTEKLKGQRVNIALPKFRITQEFELNKILSAMGMSLAFTGRADFSGMDGRRDLLISNVIHKAFVDVNEEGTEAAAAAAVAIKPTAAPPGAEPVEFRADRPFIFAVRDRKSGSILFIGRVANPKE